LFFILLIIISITYFTLIISLIIGFNLVPLFKFKNSNKNHKFTIIIPFRNEAENISILTKSLQEVDYPNTHFEIIFVNDSSTDNSVPLLTEFIIKNNHWKLIDNKRKSNSPKKDAIQTAVQQSNYDWIITTDADCELPKNWLASFNSFIELNKEVKMIAAPVTYKVNTAFLQQFQQMDFLSLIGTTIGSFGINKAFMCNGANLCYNKQLFLDLNGFDGNNNIASGDDVFLLEKFIQQYPKQVKYLKTKEALVITKPENNFKDLVNQRIRWASKTNETKSLFGKIVGLLVLLMNIISLWSLFFGLWFTTYTNFLLLIIFLKWIIDFVLINKTYQFSEQKLSLSNYLLSSFFYPFFVIFVVVKSIFTKVVWKERVFFD